MHFSFIWFSTLRLLIVRKASYILNLNGSLEKYMKDSLTKVYAFSLTALF